MKTAAVPPPEDAEVPLVFEWEGRSRAHWRLAGLVALSLLIHAIGFYVLQVAYTPTGSQLPPPVQVLMARPERPDDPPEIRAQARALAHWLTITDPALAVQPMTPDPASNPGAFVSYVPSYKAAPPPFKPLDPPSAGSAAPPRPRPPGPVPMFPTTRGSSGTGPSPGTRVIFGGSLAALVPSPLPVVTLALPVGTKTLSPTVFLVGARPEGGVSYLFREGSSGEVSADDFAQDYLSRLHFQAADPANGATVWGRVEFDWGREVYR